MPNAPRNTGLQVIHYIGALLTAQTPFLLDGVLLGELPLGSVITDADIAVVGAFGSGVRIRFHRTKGGPVLASLPLGAVGRIKLASASPALTAPEAVLGGPIYVSVNTPPVPGSLAAVVLSFAPVLG